MEQTDENKDDVRGPDGGVRGFEIRTMEKDLRALTGEEPAAFTNKNIPKRIASSRGNRAHFFDKNRLPKKYLAPALTFLVILIVSASILGTVAWVKRKEPQQPQPPTSHSVCKDAQCKLVEGEGENECAKDEDCGSATRESAVLVPRVVKETLLIDPPTREQFSSALGNALTNDRQEYSIRALTLETVEGSTPQPIVEFVKAKEILGISLPSDILSRVDAYTLVLYAAGQREKDHCAEDGVSNPQCWGARLGVILKMNAAGREPILQNLRNWEPKMLNDLDALILASANETAPEFQDFAYRDVAIRYKNLEISTVTVNYAVMNDLLVIGTSKYTMFSILDLLLQP